MIFQAEKTRNKLNKWEEMRKDFLYKQGKILMNNKKEVFKLLTKSENDWEITRFEAIHKPTKIVYWIANGLIFFSNDMHVNIGFWNWLKLWIWLKKVKRMQIIKKLQLL